MSKQKPINKPVKSNLSKGVEGFDSLAELALNMRCAWNHATDEVWQKLDPALWVGARAVRRPEPRRRSKGERRKPESCARRFCRLPRPKGNSTKTA